MLARPSQFPLLFGCIAQYQKGKGMASETMLLMHLRLHLFILARVYTLSCARDIRELGNVTHNWD